MLGIKLRFESTWQQLDQIELFLSDPPKSRLVLSRSQQDLAVTGSYQQIQQFMGPTFPPKRN